jgi:hypothetical protein
MKFEDMVGMKFDFYGVCNNEFKLGDTVFEALENPSDGYRSYLGSVEVRESDGLFFRSPLARVRVEAVTATCSDEGWSLVDVEDGHEWLFVGTNYGDEYYPCFVFRYTPKPGQTNFAG